MEEAARLVIGQAKLAVDLVQTGKYQKAVSIGGGLHHAKSAAGEGFCLYNDVAFTAIYLMERYHLKRIHDLDTDAHAGNGTADYFYSDPRVLFVDVHQDPGTIYPGSGFASEIGSGEGLGKTVNIPLPVNAGNDSYKLVFEEIVEPLAKEFQPEIIIRNGGSDPHFNDGLTSLGLTVAGFRMIGQKVRLISDICGKSYRPVSIRVSPGSITVRLDGIAIRIWRTLMSRLKSQSVPQSLRIDTHMPETIKVISEVKSYHKDYWRCFR